MMMLSQHRLLMLGEYDFQFYLAEGYQAACAGLSTEGIGRSS